MFLSSCLRVCRHNSVSVVIVYATLMIDNMLLTSVVPILPEFFMEEQQRTEIRTKDHNTNIFNESLIVTTTMVNREHDISNITETKPILITGEIGHILNTSEIGPILNSSEIHSNCTGETNKEKLAAKNLFLAFLLASKPMVQLIANIFVGPLIDKIGYDVPMFIGYIILIASSLIFAFGNEYGTLFFARSLQAVGSACAATAGMALLASQYQDDDERGRKIGVALGGLAMGVLVGPSFASLTYQITGGKELPFIILACGAFFVAILQVFARIYGSKEIFEVKSDSSIWSLLKDPYVLIAAATLTLGNMSIGVLETSLPTWVLTTLCATEWMLGIAMLPPAISYLIATTIFGRVGTSGYRWLICFISFFVTAIGSIVLPLCTTFLQIIGPGLLIGVATGMVDSSIFPILGQLADTRHSSVYGRIYAIGDASFCMAYILGPLLAGTIVHEIGFTWVMVTVAILSIVFAPLVLFLRNPPSLKEERQAILYDPNGSNSEIDSTGFSIGRVLEQGNNYEKLE